MRLVGVGAAPLVLSTRALGLHPSVAAPSERVRLAILGAGVRWNQLARDLPHEDEIVTVADANLPRTEALAALCSTPSIKVRASSDYRKLMDGRALDAQIEKPLSNYFAEGRALVDAARKHNRVVQTGTQQNTKEVNRYA